jgi:hypothetical protein
VNIMSVLYEDNFMLFPSGSNSDGTLPDVVLNSDLAGMISILSKRVNADNGLTNDVREYEEDIKEVLLCYVNPDLGTDFIATSNGFSGSLDFTNMVFSLIVLRTEIHILDRKIDLDVELSMTADSPAGRISTRDRPTMRVKYRRDNQMMLYEKLVDIYRYGYTLDQGYAIDLTLYLTNRD